MAIDLHRRKIAAAMVPILSIFVMPSAVFAQMPRLDAIAGTPDPVTPYMYVPQPPELTNFAYEETHRNAFVRFFTEGEWYFSWGASREAWAPTNIHVSQPSLHNNFTVSNVHANDDPSWSSLFGGQYNFRIGRFVDEAQTLAVELNFDHTKYTSVINQTANITGTLGGKQVNGNYQLNSSFFSYDLHNGANHIMFNLVKRIPLIGETNEPFSVAGLLKGGFGVMAPHPENSVMGQYVNVGPKSLNNAVSFQNGWWQLDGWTTGIEAGIRINLTRHVYLEITDKVAFARLYGVSVNQGRATHNLWMDEGILSLGVTFGGGR